MATERRDDSVPWLERTVPASGLAVFRIAFGALMVLAIARYFANGWIAAQFEVPTYFFSYGGLAWVKPLPAPWMHVLFAALGALALLVALGLFYRVAIVLFALGFTWVHLCDKTNYLNHYYLISLLAGLMAFLPMHVALSLDARRKPALARATVPALWLDLLRFQIGLVYVFAGIAKLQADWLFDAQPLRLWLSRRADLPLIGPLLAEPWVAYALSWAGALFDLAIPFLLLVRRLRRWAWGVLVLFHVITAVLFPIGLFPWLMIAFSIVFWDPGWVERLRRRPGPAPAPAEAARPHRLAVTAVAVYAVVQVALPLRHWLYPGSVLWTEEGFRFSWRVMLIEKKAQARFFAVDAETGVRTRIHLGRYLTPVQAWMMSTQPDMVAQFARHLGVDVARRTGRRQRICAEVRVSLNGRPHRRLIDPRVDLSRAASLEAGLVRFPPPPRRRGDGGAIAARSPAGG